MFTSTRGYNLPRESARARERESERAREREVRKRQNGKLRQLCLSLSLAKKKDEASEENMMHGSGCNAIIVHTHTQIYA